MVTRCIYFLCCLLVTTAPASVWAAGPTVVGSEFIFEQAPFAECHASTIAETPQGLVASWFGGKREGDPSVGIWLARHDGTNWSTPLEVVSGNQRDETSDETRGHPCWNPVLHQLDGGPLLLFYKVGPNPRQWWGMVMRSSDAGQQWSAPVRLPDGILGPIKNKPIQLADGTLLSGSSTEHAGWRVHFEWSSDGGQTWQKSEPINTGDDFGIIQPTLFRTEDGTVVAYCRSRQQRIIETRSRDNGRTWTDPQATSLPNPNSGIDGVTLADGRHALIYNHTQRGRSPLNLAIAADDALAWAAPLALESDPGEYSYPAIIQTRDGRLHMTYTWKRKRVKHVVVDPGPPGN
jgi:predicted neuraminidase